MTSIVNSGNLHNEESVQRFGEMPAHDRQAHLMSLHRHWQESAVRRQWSARARHASASATQAAAVEGA
jgi:hypothetical protein